MVLFFRLLSIRFRLPGFVVKFDGVLISEIALWLFSSGTIVPA